MLPKHQDMHMHNSRNPRELLPVRPSPILSQLYNKSVSSGHPPVDNAYPAVEQCN